MTNDPDPLKPASPSGPEPTDADPANARDRFEPIEGELTLTNTFDALLKKPGGLLYEMHRGEADPRRLVGYLALTAAACLLAFGFVLGCFSGGEMFWASPLKLLIGVGLAALITLPSLYIFSCLEGLDVDLRSVAGVMAAAICLLSLLLLGLAPVAWIFSQSTTSVAFFGGLTLSFWLIALCFGLELVFRAARHLGVKKRFHLAIWAAIFALVTLQMSTSLRPLLGEAEDFLPSEKKFFLAHWFESMGGESAD